MALPSPFRMLSALMRSRRVLAGLVLAGGLGLTLGLWQWQKQLALNEQQGDFVYDTAAVTMEIRERLRLHAQFLRALQAFAATSPSPSLEAWRHYGRHLRIARGLPGLLAFGYAPLVERGTLPDFQARLRRQPGLANFQAFPASQHPRLAPVIFVGPETGLVQQAIGFDLLSEAVRQTAAEKAIDTSDVALSGRLVLAFDKESSRPGFLLMEAVYDPTLPVDNVVQRRQAVQGFVFTAYRVEEFFSSMGQSIVNRFALRIFDESIGANRADPPLLYDSRGDQTPLLVHTPNVVREVDFGGRTWSIQFFDITQRNERFGLDTPDFVLIGGVLLSLLLAALFHSLARLREQALNLSDQARDELANSEERFRLMAKGSNDGLWDVDLVSGEDYLSERFHEIFGFPPGEGQSSLRGYREWIWPESRPLLDEALRRHLRDQAPFDLPIHIRRCDGSSGWIRVRGEAMRGIDGRAIRLAGTITDITAIRATEEALVSANQLMQDVLDNASELAIIATDPQGLITVFNRGAEQMLGYAGRDVIGQTTPLRFCLTSDIEARSAEWQRDSGTRCEGFEVLVHHVRQNQSERREWHFVNKAGLAFVVDVFVTAQRSGNGDLFGFLLIASDVTARKQTEAELLEHRDHLQELVAERTALLEKALNEARSASQAKSEFLTNMSHELRTPMHAIVNFAALGLEKSSANGQERLAQYFSRIMQSTERLLSLISDLLDLSKLEAGRMAFSIRPHDVREIIQRTISHLESLLHAKQISISVDCDAPRTIVPCDEKRLEQVIHNLLSNAIKFCSEQGHIGITLTMAMIAKGRRATDAGMMPALVIHFQDNGIGIPPNELNTIFEKFVQSSKTRTGAGGTGLGLSICREIIARHRGTIAAKNNPEGGATFTVALPYEAQSDPE